jgi:flagellar biogenesis protein FliO
MSRSLKTWQLFLIVGIFAVLMNVVGGLLFVAGFWIFLLFGIVQFFRNRKPDNETNDE